MKQHDYLSLPLHDRRYLIHRRAKNHYNRLARPCLNGRLLDIGCGDKPMKDFFSDRVTEHVGLDHPDTQHARTHVDIVATAYETRQPDASFDSVLCTNVLEHLEEPERAVREAFRVLRPGGHAVYSVPLFWPLHEEPRDFYRFTRYGLLHLFEKAGFDIVALQACGGYWTTAITMFHYYLHPFGKGPLRLLTAPLTLLGNLLGLVLERIHTDERFTWMYLVVARKPALSPDREHLT